MMTTGTLNFDNISELEKEITIDFLLKEGIEILEEEIDYFFSLKEPLVDSFVGDTDLKKLNLAQLQDRVDKMFWSPKEVSSLILKIEKRIQKEINRTLFSGEFKFSNYKSDRPINLRDSSIIIEKLRTYKLSQSVAKYIDATSIKSLAGVLPKEAKKFSSKFRPGSHILGLLGVSPKEIESGLKEKMQKILRGMLKQSKLDISNVLKREIIENLALMPQLEEVAEKLEASKHHEVKTDCVQIA